MPINYTHSDFMILLVFNDLLESKANYFSNRHKSAKWKDGKVLHHALYRSLFFDYQKYKGYADNEVRKDRQRRNRKDL